MIFEPFRIATFQGSRRVERGLPFEFISGYPFRPFRIADPFGLRNAVNPVFRSDPDGRLFGMGTAFHVDCWGTLLTAEHVVDFLTAPLLMGRYNAGEDRASLNEGAVVFLGLGGVIFGDLPIPNWALQRVAGIAFNAAEVCDPMAELQGRSTTRAYGDVASLQVHLDARAEFVSCLPVRLSNWRPSVGELVFAVGYPELDCSEIETGEMRALISEGMYGAYARVTQVLPEGRSAFDTTPGFEVQGDWRGGMSGGPVFNSSGEVVGVVSRSLAPTEDEQGVGFAVCPAWMDGARALLPSLDPSNPGHRIGHGVVRQEPWAMSGVFRTLEEATQKLALHPEGYEIHRGSHRLGTDDFVLSGN